MQGYMKTVYLAKTIHIITLHDIALDQYPK
jgi:hypothetical protein